MQNKKAVLATLFAALLFATSATSRTLSGVDASSITIATVRLVVGSLGLLVFAKFSIADFSMTRLLKKKIIWIMGFGVAGYQAFFFIGTGLTGVAIGTLSSLALAPLMAGLLSWVWHGIKPSAAWLISTLIALVGLVVLSWSGLEDSNINLLGVVASLLAGAAYAIYTVVGVNLSQSGESATSVLAVSFSIGAFVLLIVSGANFAELANTNGILLTLWLGFVATSFAYVLFGIGISKLSAGTVATLNLAEPLAASFLGFVVLHESISALSAVGCALIAASLAFLAINTAKEAANDI